MKTILHCIECTESGVTKPYVFSGDYYDCHTIETVCPNGHQVFSIVQSYKFETLLTAAADALVHDQTIQAVACLAAARERLFELSIQVFMRSHGIDEHTFSLTWRDVAAQSERQLGAFLFLYLLATGNRFVIDPALAKLRNAALHKGEIPTTEGAFEFAEKTFDEIKRVADYLRKEHSDSLREILHEEIKRRAARTPNGVRTGTIALFGIYGMVADHNYSSFNEAFEQYKLWIPELDGLTRAKQGRKAHT